MKQGGILATVTAALALFAPALAGSARADVVDGGHLRLKPSGALAKAFAREGVELTGLKPAKGGGAGVTLPISSGLSEIQHGSGYFFFDGGFRLRAGKRTVTVRRLILNENEHWLRGVVNGVAMKLAEPAPQEANADGFGVDLAIGSLKLTGRAATTFNHKLGLHGVFQAGRSLGSLTGVAQFEFLTVRSGEITIEVDDGFREKLASLETSVGVAGSAKVVSSSPLVVSIPVEIGQIAPDASTGVLLTQGGLSFSQHNESFDHGLSFLDTNIALDSHLVSGDANYAPNPQQVPFTGPFATLSTPLTSVQADPATGEIAAAQMPMVLRPNLAAVMDEVFAAPAGQPNFFTGGETIGTVAFRVRTR